MRFNGGLGILFLCISFISLSAVASAEDATAHFIAKKYALPPETLALTRLLRHKLKLGKNWGIDVHSLSVKNDWAYLIGGLRVFIDGAWEEPNDGGLAALFKKSKGRWMILDWARYGPEQDREVKFSERIRISGAWHVPGTSPTPNASSDRVGGGINPPVLSHHRTYGSVYGGS